MSEEKIKILGITGPSGCGKDTAARWLADNFPNKYKFVKLHTTRPQRNEEDNGYYFYSSNDFLEQVLNGNMPQQSSNFSNISFCSSVIVLSRSS